MPEKEIKGIKKFFEEFKAFAMRGNVLDMPAATPISSTPTAPPTANEETSQPSWDYDKERTIYIQKHCVRSNNHYYNGKLSCYTVFLCTNIM